MSIRGVASLVALLACLVAPVASARSEIYVPTTTIDAATLLGQLDAWRLAHPEQKEATYELAKAHCYIYAYNRSRFAVTPSHIEGAPPRIVEQYEVPIRSAASRLPVSEARLNHLVEVLLIGRSSGLNLYGYVCREAAARCEEPGWPGERFEIPEGFERARAHWQAEALSAFRKMRAARKPVPDEYRMRMDHEPMPEFESLFLYRMLSAKENRSAAEDAELKEITANACEVMSLLHGPIEGDYDPQRDLPFTSGGEGRLSSLYPPVPPEENGAEYYLHAADAYIAFDFPHNVPMPFSEWRTGEPGEFDTYSEDTLRVMEEYLSANAESLRLMREAVRYEAYRYPSYFMGVTGFSFAGTIGVKSLTHLAGVQVASASRKGEQSVAVENLIAMMSCAKSLRGVPDTMAMLTRIGITSQAMEVLQWVVSEVELSEQQLMDLQRAVASMEDVDGFRVAVQGLEVPESVPVSHEEAREHAIARKITDINDPANANLSVTEEEIDAAAAELQVGMKEAIQSLNATASVQKEHAQLPLDELYERVRVYGEDQMSLSRPIVDHAHDAIGRMSLAHLRSIAEVRVAQASLAVARLRLRTGEYPNDLDPIAPSYLPRSAFVDPFTGEPLRVQRLGREFTVYSEGYPALNKRVSMRQRTNTPSGIFFTIAPQSK